MPAENKIRFETKIILPLEAVGVKQNKYHCLMANECNFKLYVKIK